MWRAILPVLLGVMRWSCLGGAAVATVACLALPAQAGHSDDLEGFAVYEDWKSAPDIRGDRWRGVADSAQDVQKEQQGHRTHLRVRREGSSQTNFGFAGAGLGLGTAHPLNVDRFDVEVRVKNLEIIGCAGNPFPSTAFPVQLSLSKFNDGTPGPTGDFTGDHFGRLRLFRDSTATDRTGALQVQFVIFRCDNAACSVITPIPDGFIVFPDLVYVGDRIRLRLIWDAANDRFVAGVNDGPDIALPYPSSLNQGPPRVPFSNINVFSSGASCFGQAGVADASVEVGVVRTNPSAVIP